MFGIRKVLFIALLSLVAVNAETLQTVSQEMISSPTGIFKNENTSAQSKVISVVFYRLNGNKNYVATVKAGNNVVGSLLPNHYADAKVCKKRLLVGIAERGDIINITHYDLSNLNITSNTIYLKVVEPTGNNRFALSVTNPQVAQKEISSLNLKSNIINRHVPSCEKLDSNSDLVKRVTIGAYSLFDFNDAKLNKQAIAELFALTHDIKLNESLINGIHVTGYTDRLGSKLYNLELSKRRASSVAEYMRSNGVLAEIYSSGLGESNPVSRNCNRLSIEALRECLQPDRRVIIDIIIKKINPINEKIPQDLL